MLENIFALFKEFPQFSNGLAAGLIIFARFLAFFIFAPIFGRKDIPFNVKIGLAIILTAMFINILHIQAPPRGTSFILAIVLNGTFGMLIGFIATCIFDVVTAAGDTINSQMGLSAAMILDPSTKTQSSLMGNLVGFIGTIIFINLDGMQWLISAFVRGFEIFPIYSTSIPLAQIINMNYLIEITSNVLIIGLQIASPILIATLALDVILGIISKIAPQINVFQLSFLFKPLLGMAIILALLPLLVNIITDHFLYYSRIF